MKDFFDTLISTCNVILQTKSVQVSHIFEVDTNKDKPLFPLENDRIIFQETSDNT